MQYTIRTNLAANLVFAGGVIVKAGVAATVNAPLSSALLAELTSAVAAGHITVVPALPGGTEFATVAMDDSLLTSREYNVQALSLAILLATELQSDMAAHFASATRHTTGQQSSAAFQAVTPVDLATVIQVTNLLQTAYAAHNADAILASGWAYHSEQATTKALADATAVTTLQTVLTKLNDLKAKYNDHEDETTGHNSTSSITAHQVAAADVSYGAAIWVADPKVASGDKVEWSILDDGTGNVTGVSAVAGTGGITFTFSADPQNDCIISYEVSREM